MEWIDAIFGAFDISRVKNQLSSKLYAFGMGL